MDMNETNNVVTPEDSAPVEATPVQVVPVQEEPKKAAGMAIASMILGICSIVCCCVWYVSVICAIVAIVLGILSKKKNEGSNGMSTAGIICGAVGIVALILYVTVLAGLLVGAGSLASYC